MPEPPGHIVETDWLRLTLHESADFGPLAEMWSDPAVVRHISGKPATAQESWARLLRYRGLWPVLGFGYWAVCLVAPDNRPSLRVAEKTGFLPVGPIRVGREQAVLLERRT